MADGELHRGWSFEIRALNIDSLGKVIFSLFWSFLIYVNNISDDLMNSS